MALLLPAAIAVAALAGCGGLGARLTFDDTEKVRITEIRMSGGSGDVTVTTAPIAETRIKRVVRTGTDPGESYRLDGTTLLVDTDCGSDCAVSYEIEAPTGVTVTGELSSGDVDLTGVGSAAVQVTSGNVLVKSATGPVEVRATSGDVDVTGAKGPVTADVTSGNIRAIDVAGPVTLTATSGDVEVRTNTAASVLAEARSGSVDAVVPPGAYAVRADTGSGEAQVLNGITNDPSSASVLEIRATSGDVTISARGPRPSASAGG